MRNAKCEMVVRRQILRLSSHCSAFTLSNIRHFTPLRMTKCAAEYRWWRCPKVAFQSLVTSHQSLATHPQSPIPSHQPPVTPLPRYPHSADRGCSFVSRSFVIFLLISHFFTGANFLLTNVLQKNGTARRGVNRLFTESTVVNKKMGTRENDEILRFQRCRRMLTSLIHRYSQFSVYIQGGQVWDLAHCRNYEQVTFHNSQFCE